MRENTYCALRALTPRLTGAGARSAEGTNTGHENAEGMASVGVRVEPTVRLGRAGTVRRVPDMPRLVRLVEVFCHRSRFGQGTALQQ